MKNRGLFPLSADPLTNGHLDIITRAAADCKHLIVLICDNDSKRGSYLFSLNERRAMTERAVRQLHLANVIVHVHEGLLVDAVLQHGCDAIFRGIRTVDDRAEEEQQMRYHDLICPGMTAKINYLEATDALRDVSSTLVKAFTMHDADISSFVPAFIKAALEERLRHQWKIAVTGEIASGKTWVTQRLAETLTARGCPTHTINFDQLIRDLYSEPSAGAQQVREQLAEMLGNDVLTSDHTAIERRILAERLFHPDTSSAVRTAVHELTTPHVMRLYRQALRSARGIVLIEWAQLAEMNMGWLANHRSIIVQSPERSAFAAARGLTSEALRRISTFQWTADQKAASLADQARRAGGGSILHFENRRNDPAQSQQTLSVLADAILQEVPPTFQKQEGAA